MITSFLVNNKLKCHSRLLKVDKGVLFMKMNLLQTYNALLSVKPGNFLLATSSFYDFKKKINFLTHRFDYVEWVTFSTTMWYCMIS